MSGDKETDTYDIVDPLSLPTDDRADLSEFEQTIEDMLAEDDEDDGGFDQPFEEAKAEDQETVGPEEGHKLTEKANLAKDDRAKKDEPKVEAEEKAEDAPKEDDKPKEDAPKEDDKPKEDAPDLTAAKLDDLLADLPDDRKGEINRRMAESQAAMAPFEKAFVQGQMKQFGATPAQVADRLTDLAQFAQEKPNEYIAWVAQSMAQSPDKIGDVLNEAAKLHGYKVVKDEPESDDDDLFDDPEKAQMRRRIAELESQSNPQPQWGPDAPQRVSQRTVEQTITALTTEAGPDGKPLRPHFSMLMDPIGQRAKAKFEQTGQPVTQADLAQIYDDVTRELGIGTAPAPAADTSAAQGQPPVQDKATTAAKAASKSIDGTGQGAPRRPALPDGASTRDIISHYLDNAGD